MSTVILRLDTSGNVRKYTPAPKLKTALKIVVGLVFAFFMISAWDDFLDELIRQAFGLTSDSLGARLIRALIATVLAIVVLAAVNIHLDDLLGAFLD